MGRLWWVSMLSEQACEYRLFWGVSLNLGLKNGKA
jgi:hypothetical protein